MKHEQTIFGQAPSKDDWRTIPLYDKYQINGCKQIRALYRYKGSHINPHYEIIKCDGNSVQFSINGNKIKFSIDYLYEICFGIEHIKSLDGEVWIPINGYEGYYKISNKGRVLAERKFITRKNGVQQYCKEQIIKPQKINSGYFVVNLIKGNTSKKHIVHRLVALHFIPNPYNYDVVNHKDENRLNNDIDNLEWCSRSYNRTYGTSEQRRISTRLQNNNGNYGYKRKINI